MVPNKFCCFFDDFSISFTTIELSLQLLNQPMELAPTAIFLLPYSQHQTCFVCRMQRRPPRRRSLLSNPSKTGLTTNDDFQIITEYSQITLPLADEDDEENQAKILLLGCWRLDNGIDRCICYLSLCLSSFHLVRVFVLPLRNLVQQEEPLQSRGRRIKRLVKKLQQLVCCSFGSLISSTTLYWLYVVPYPNSQHPDSRLTGNKLEDREKKTLPIFRPF